MDMMRRASPRGVQDQHHTPPGKVSGGDEAVLAVVAARVLNGDGAAGEHQPGISEVQPSMVRSRVAARFSGSKLMSTELLYHTYRVNQYA
jgi:hypothetical protein